MDQGKEFLERVLKKLPQAATKDYFFASWNDAGKPTDEGVGLLPCPGADPENVIRCVLDVDHYVGNVGHVEECRAITDDRFELPQQVRFYQRVKIPILGSIHHELVLTDGGTIDGYRVAYWACLDLETGKLDGKRAARSQYSVGAWLAKPGLVGYALSSAPRRDDVGFLKWKALTKGANAGASLVLRDNIKGMADWAGKL